MCDLTHREAEDREVFNPHALSQAVSELCSIAADDPEDAVDRCRNALTRFSATGLPRRERVSSTMALYLATKNRMKVGRSKAFVEAQLSGALRSFHMEGRNLEVGRRDALFA